MDAMRKVMLGCALALSGGLPSSSEARPPAAQRSRLPAGEDRHTLAPANCVGTLPFPGVPSSHYSALRCEGGRIVLVSHVKIDRGPDTRGPFVYRVVARVQEYKASPDRVTLREERSRPIVVDPGRTANEVVELQIPIPPGRYIVQAWLGRDGLETTYADGRDPATMQPIALRTTLKPLTGSTLIAEVR